MRSSKIVHLMYEKYALIMIQYRIQFELNESHHLGIMWINICFGIPRKWNDGKCSRMIIRFYFIFQAILFYIPRWLWKNWEAGKISALKMDLDLGIITEAEKRQKKKLLLDYLYSNLKNHNFWAYRYFFCEFLALLNVFGK